MTDELRFSSANAHVKEYLDDYCNLSSPPRFAVLIKGAWGSGKTWFIEQYQKSLDDKEVKHLYVSLYGISNVTEIEDRFFQLLNPIMSSRGMTIAGIIVKGLLKGALKIDLNGDGKDDGNWNIQIPNIDLPKKLDNIDKSILIFDDLERCNIEVSILLGYINYFVEHNDMKVILIAHEDKLLANVDYLSIKEKMIGKTLSISPVFEDALTLFIENIKDAESRDFLENNFDTIRDLYQKTNYENLRSLNHILFEFSRVFEKLPETVRQHPEALKCILKTLTALSIEIHQGKIVPENISKITTQYSNYLDKRNSNSLSNNTQNQDIENRQNPNRLLDDYPFLDRHQIFPSLNWWTSFLAQGRIDIKELSSSILSSKYFQDNNTPNWVRLWHFSELSDDAFEELIKEVELDFRNRVYSDHGVITHIVGLFLMLSNVGIYKRTLEDILEDGMKYIDELKNLNRLEPLWPQYIHSAESKIPESYRNLGFQGGETKEFEIFRNYLRNSREQAGLEEIPQKAQKLIQIMCEDIFEFHKMICLDHPFGRDSYSEDIKYYNIPVLSFIDVHVFLEKILVMKHDDAQYIFWAFSERYKFDNRNLLDELDWLKSVQQFLLNEASRREGQLSGYKMTLLNDHYLVSAIERLSATKESLQDQSIS